MRKLFKWKSKFYSEMQDYIPVLRQIHNIRAKNYLHSIEKKGKEHYNINKNRKFGGRKMSEEVNKRIQEFIKKVQQILEDRLKK